MQDRHQSSLKIIFTAMLLWFAVPSGAQNLKSVIYDFDGFDNGASSLPEGDYSYGDLSYQISSNPAQAGHMIGDRCLKLDVQWNNGYAAFGRGISRFVELDALNDHLNFYFYNPASNNQQAICEISIADDDNQNNTYESASDDNWKKTVTINSSTGWQLHSIPLNSFTDGNSGGNGVFDIAFTQNKGMLLLTEFRFSKPSGTASNAIFYIDMIAFTEGALTTGASVVDPPAKQPADHCLLGAFQPVAGGNHHLIPVNVEGLFPAIPGHKLKYVNTYLQWSFNGTVPNAFPGNSIQTLLNNGYRPIITWEPMFLSLAPLDPAQPSLDKILNGNYDAYIDSFAAQMMTYSDTVIIRFMHEFDGDWYPWCISQNGKDPNKFISVFQKVVNMFKTKGATKVKWMWCPNSDYAPYEAYNWIVSAYPGNNYVDYVGTDVYNAHYPASLPWWRSFRWQATESCYYLTKYFPSKPLIICELGCRERISGENISSQTKGEWYAAMDKDLQSHFSNVRGLIFFDANTGPVKNWVINSGTPAFESVRDNIWADSYYFGPAPVISGWHDASLQPDFFIYPIPANDQLYLQYDRQPAAADFNIRVFDLQGKLVLSVKTRSEGNIPATLDIQQLKEGSYLMVVQQHNRDKTQLSTFRKQLLVAR